MAPLKLTNIFLCLATSAYTSEGQDAVALIQTRANALYEFNDGEDGGGIADDLSNFDFREATRDDIVFDGPPPIPGILDDVPSSELKLLRPARNLSGKPMMWLHVSKSAGSFFCACANREGKNQGLSHEEGTNCHFLDQDRPFWSKKHLPKLCTHESGAPATHEYDCGKLEELYKKNGIGVEGNENFLHNGELCPNFHNVLIVRDPIYRLASHISYLGGNIAAETWASVQDKWPWLTDNYLTRVLVGKPMCTSPSRMMKQTDLLKAQATLHNFDDIFTAEFGLTEQVEKSLGWNCGHVPGRTSKNAGGTNARVEQLMSTWSKEDIRALKDSHSLDYALYKQAVRLSRHR